MKVCRGQEQESDGWGGVRFRFPYPTSGIICRLFVDEGEEDLSADEEEDDGIISLSEERAVLCLD